MGGVVAAVLERRQRGNRVVDGRFGNLVEPGFDRGLVVDRRKCTLTPVACYFTSPAPQGGGGSGTGAARSKLTRKRRCGRDSS